MASISGTIPNVIGGISQQPPAVRLENTAGDLKNAIPSVVSGLRKRPPMRYLGNMDIQDALGDGKIYPFYRPSKGVRYISVLDNVIRVFTEAGVEEPVTMVGAAATYLTTVNERKNISFLPFADTLFINNRSVTPAKTAVAETRPDPTEQLTVVVENTAYGTTFGFEIQYNDDTFQTGTYKTHNTDPNDVDKIVTELVTSFNADPTQAATASSETNVITIPSANIKSFRVMPESLVRGYRDTIDKFTNLPPVENDGRIVRVAGDPDNTQGSYFVSYDELTGLWEEVTAHGATDELDTTTMPHVLVDNGDGTWDFKAHTWTNRAVGDDEANPHPSFIGQPIEDMAIVANRLVILADENFIASEIDQFENFYRTTCTSLIDSDRIDVAALSTSGHVSKLYHLMDFDEALLIFADQQQFKVDLSNGLSPNSMNIKPTTSFSCSVEAAPVKLGNNVLFVDDVANSTWADIREYMIDNVVGVSTSEIVTKQCPELIPSGVTQVISNPTLGLSCVFSQGNKNRLYTYNSFWSDGNRLQSAWSYWEDPNVEFITGVFVGNRLYLVLNRNGKLELTYVDLQETIEGDVNGLEIQLDLRTSIANAAFGSNATSFSMPYIKLAGEEYMAVLTADGVAGPAGTAYPVVLADNSDQATVVGANLSNDQFLVGKKYSFEYLLSPIYNRDQGKVPIQDGRLQLRYLSFLFHQSSYFRVEVTPPGRSTFTAVYAGRTLGRLTNIVGDVAVNDGELRVACPCEASRMVVKVINDSPYNSRFSSIEWEGAWRPKTRRSR